MVKLMLKLPQTIGPNNVSVPTHFFKVICGKMPSGAVEIQAYVLVGSGWFGL